MDDYCRGCGMSNCVPIDEVVNQDSYSDPQETPSATWCKNCGTIHSFTGGDVIEYVRPENILTLSQKKERERERNRAYYQAHKDDWKRRADPDKKRVSDTRYREKNRDKIRAYNTNWKREKRREDAEKGPGK